MNLHESHNHEVLPFLLRCFLARSGKLRSFSLFCFYGERGGFLFGLKLLLSCFAWEKLLFISEATGLETLGQVGKVTFIVIHPTRGCIFLGMGSFPRLPWSAWDLETRHFFVCVCGPQEGGFGLKMESFSPFFLEFWFTLDTVSW